MSTLVIKAQRITRSFVSRQILRGINFEIHQGEAIAVKGLNGSGKTTLLRILATLLKPSSGEIYFFGQNVFDVSKIRPKIGVLFSDGFFYEDLSVVENLQLYARLYGLKNHLSIINFWMQRFDIFFLSKEPVRNLSKGERQRVILIRSMLHSPSLLLWDEPTTALDEKARQLFKEIALECKEKATIVCATHDLESTEGWVDRQMNLLNGYLQ